MQRFLLACLLGLSGLWFSPTSAQTIASADAEAPASLSLLVFENGRPVPGLLVSARERRTRTDADGSVLLELAPGPLRLRVADTATELTVLPLTLRPSEILQIIVTLRGPERRAFVSIESSHALDAPAAVTETRETVEQEGAGVLSGRIVSTEDESPVVEARLFVSGTPVEVRTDEEGRYRIELPVGRYAVSVLHPDFATRTIDGVEVLADQTTERDFQLPPAGLELAEFVVVEPFIQGSLSSVIDEQRTVAGVANVIGAEQFSRSGDGDAGSALSRVTGLTLVGGEFVYIRGLGERYSSTLLNGANVPSPDPTRKVVPLNLFPTGVIESILVQKSYSPEMPGDFGGGAVEIRTRGIPEEDFFSIGFSVGARQDSTGEKGLGYRGGDLDFLGIDDGTRELSRLAREATANNTQLRAANPFFPEGIPPEEMEAIGESFPVIYDARPKTLGPDLGLSIEGGQRFDFAERWTAGFTAAILWGDSEQTRVEERRSFTPLGDGSLQPNDDYTIDRTRRNVELSGFLTAGLSFDDRHSIDVTSMILRQTEDEVSVQEGFNLDEDGIIRITELEWEERELISNQVEGAHRFSSLADLGLEWDYSESRANRYVPDQRRYRYDPDSIADFIFSRRADNNVRRFSNLDDKAIDWGIDLDLPWSLGPIELTASAGYRLLEKDRASSIRRFQFGGANTLSFDQRRAPSLEDIFNADTIEVGGVVIGESTRATDNYSASLDVEAYYGNLDMTFFERLRLSAGARMEDWDQSVTTFALFDPNAEPILAELEETDLLPAAALTWYLTDRQQLRVGFAETLIRPDFKELSPAPFTDPVLNREVIGNENLQPSAVTHYDLRWEFYPSPDELVSLGVFYKLIDQPIELTVEPGVEQRLTFTNALEAENFGIEFEARQQLAPLARRWPALGWLDRFFVAGNLSWIESEISIDELGILTSSSRALQGQSPYIINVQLGYDDPDRGLSATLLFNQVGARIAEVGVLGAPDKEESPAPQLDFIIQYRWRDWLGLKAKFGNLLDSDFEVRQGDEITQRYNVGRTVSLSVDLDF
ncbi:TonB-dependent receptor [Wenzhouxiangella marina]|nr:TonB-dependent receptor [Wenzhouxiangella marina]MBB6086001.1 outer membrane receptor protein involved in Fe transport [Wenzhouxiangella marina]